MAKCPGCRGTGWVYLTVLGSDADLVTATCYICGGTKEASGFAVYYTADGIYKNTFKGLYADEVDANNLARTLKDGYVVAL